MTKIAMTAKERTNAIHKEVCSRICFLDDPPGTRLKEEELAEEFGVSRTSIRRALATLEAHGYVETRHGFGNIQVLLLPRRGRQPAGSEPRLAGPGPIHPAQGRSPRAPPETEELRKAPDFRNVSSGLKTAGKS